MMGLPNIYNQITEPLNNLRGHQYAGGGYEDSVQKAKKGGAEQPQLAGNRVVLECSGIELMVEKEMHPRIVVLKLRIKQLSKVGIRPETEIDEKHRYQEDHGGSVKCQF